jgi:hypothetical protein
MYSVHTGDKILPAFRHRRYVRVKHMLLALYLVQSDICNEKKKLEINSSTEV